MPPDLAPTSSRQPAGPGDQRLLMLAHDLANRVAVITGHLELAADALDDDSPAARSVDLARRVATELAELSGTWTTLGSPDGDPPGHGEPVDLTTVLRTVVDRRHAGRRPQDPPVLLRTPPAPAWLRGDPVALEQLLENVVMNAVKYSPGADPVVAAITVSAASITLTVSDRGIGIAPGDRRRVFDAHFRSSRARGSAAAGTGLGLYLCRRIVDDHGGVIGLTARRGGGTQVRVVLPRGGPAGPVVVPGCAGRLVLP